MQDQVTTSYQAQMAASVVPAAMASIRLDIDDVLTVIAGLIEAMSLETEALCTMDMETHREIVPKKKLLADALVMHSEIMKRNPNALDAASGEQIAAMHELLEHLRTTTEENQLRVVAAQSATNTTLKAIGQAAPPLNPGPAVYTRKGMLRSNQYANAQPMPVYRDQRL